MYILRFVTGFLFLVLLLAESGCSSSRKAASVANKLEKYGKGSSIEKAIERNNIAGKGLFIAKAKIKYYEGESEIGFTANIRVNKSGELLASIRSFAGIEVARVIVTNGEVHIVERLGRKVHYLNLDSLAGGYGMGQEGIMSLFGDRIAISNYKKSPIKCKNGEGSVTTKVENIYMSEDVDCSIGKLTEVSDFE